MEKEDELNLADAEDSPNIELHENENVNYFQFEPRLAVNYKIDRESSIKFGYSRNSQFLHMVSNSTSGTPLDVWQPASSIVKPQIADQISLGYFKVNNNDKYEYSIEAYYKKMDNLIDFRDGAHVFFRNHFESELVFGKGTAYGIELFIKRNTGKLTGWIGYTLSKSERKFPDINGGTAFPAKYDRTHDFSVVSSYKLNEKWAFSANFVYSTGYNITIPYGKYNIADKTMKAYTDRNGYRIPAYHRMDIGISYENDLGGIWNLSFYNIYAHKNTYMISIRESDTFPNRNEAVRYSLFTIIPSISYTLKF